MDAQCPSRLVLDRIADKWTALIIQVLAHGTKRYAALQREMARDLLCRSTCRWGKFT